MNYELTIEGIRSQTPVCVWTERHKALLNKGAHTINISLSAEVHVYIGAVNGSLLVFNCYATLHSSIQPM